MCLQDQVIDNAGGSIDRVRRARSLSDDNRGVVRGQGIRDASEESKIMMKAAGARRRDQGIYDNNGGAGKGK